MQVLINPPKEIFTTSEEFMRFSYFDLATFFCNWKMCILKLENEDLKIFTHDEDMVDMCVRNYRFKDLQWFENRRAELYTCVVPNGHIVHKILNKRFSYLFLK